MVLNLISQIAIVFFGATAIWFVSRKDDWKRVGYILGLCAQPFWFYIAISTQQWGILVISIWYTYSWSIGVYNYWIKK